MLRYPEATANVICKGFCYVFGSLFADVLPKQTEKVRRCLRILLPTPLPPEFQRLYNNKVYHIPHLVKLAHPCFSKFLDPSMDLIFFWISPFSSKLSLNSIQCVNNVFGTWRTRTRCIISNIAKVLKMVYLPSMVKFLISIG